MGVGAHEAASCTCAPLLEQPSRTEEESHVEEAGGKVAVASTILFDNASVRALDSLGSIGEEHLDRAFHVNTKRLLFTVQKALPLLTDGESIILNASVAASKRDGSQSRLQQPGPIKTAIFNKAGLTRKQIDEFKASQIAADAGNRYGHAGRGGESRGVPLASDDSSDLTGIELFVDGGGRLGIPAGGEAEDGAEVVDALAGVFGQKAKPGKDEFPLGVGDVTRVRFVCDHTPKTRPKLDYSS